MPPRQRKPEHKGLPTGWRQRYGAYYYQVPKSLRHLWDNKTEFRLGATLPEAYRVWAERLELQRDARTIAELLEQYNLQVVPGKTWKTQESNRISISRLRKVFGAMPIAAIEPHHVYKYVDLVSKKHGVTSARRDWEVLRHVYTMAVQWGLVRAHPLLGQVRVEKPRPRDRYIEDWELVEALTVAPPILLAYVEFKLLTGLRRKDILLLRRDCIEDGELVVTPSKTARSSGMRLRFEVTPDLQAAVDAAKAVPRKVGSVWLFATRSGKCYLDETTGRANGFDSLWARWMRNAIDKTKLTERFQERDLRKKSITDDIDLEAARKRAGHTSEQITKTVYRLKGEKVKPMSRTKKDA
jgi:integrase